MWEQGLVLTVIYNFLSIKYSYKVVRSVDYKIFGYFYNSVTILSFSYLFI